MSDSATMRECRLCGHGTTSESGLCDHCALLNGNAFVPSTPDDAEPRFAPMCRDRFAHEERQHHKAMPFLCDCPCHGYGPRTGDWWKGRRD